jgi:RNA polymerase sigma-70 factor, ECF subfamily
MIFDFDRLRTRVSARAVAPRKLEDRQRDIYDSHRHRVFSVSFYMTGNEMEAEEILRGTFVRAFRQAEEPDGTAVDTALIEQLHEHVVLEDEDLPFPRTEHLPDGRNILRTDLEEAIRCLPPVERLIFLLMDVEGYSAPQVAQLLHKTTGEVLRTSIMARIRLRAEIAARRLHGDTDCQQAA